MPKRPCLDCGALTPQTRVHALGHNGQGALFFGGGRNDRVGTQGSGYYYGGGGTDIIVDDYNGPYDGGECYSVVDCPR